MCLNGNRQIWMKSKCEYCESYIQQHIINFPLNTEASYDILHNGSHSRRWAWSRYLTPNCFWWAAANQRTSETPQYHKSLASVSFLPRWVIVMVARHRDPLRRQHPRGRNATSIQNVLFTHWETISNVFRGVFRCSFRPFSSVSMAQNLWNLLNLNESESESSAWAPIQNCRAFCSFRNEGWLNYTNPSPGDFTVLLLLGSRSPQKKLRRGNESRRLTHRSQENVVEGWCRERERERERLTCPGLELSHTMTSSSVAISGGLSFTSSTWTVTGTWPRRLGLSAEERERERGERQRRWTSRALIAERRPCGFKHTASSSCSAHCGFF